MSCCCIGEPHGQMPSKGQSFWSEAPLSDGAAEAFCSAHDLLPWQELASRSQTIGFHPRTTPTSREISSVAEAAPYSTSMCCTEVASIADLKCMKKVREPADEYIQRSKFPSVVTGPCLRVVHLLKMDAVGVAFGLFQSAEPNDTKGF
eukprot:1491303-Amphidinium_carterae.1